MLPPDSLLAPMFVTAGWSPATAPAGALPPGADAVQRAAAILACCANLHVGAVGPGTEKAASDVHCEPAPCTEASELLEPWQAQVGLCVTYASAHHDHMRLFISDGGEHLLYTEPDGRLYAMGTDFEQVMRALLWGYRLGRLLEPDA